MSEHFVAVAKFLCKTISGDFHFFFVLFVSNQGKHVVSIGTVRFLVVVVVVVVLGFQENANYPP